MNSLPAEPFLSIIGGGLVAAVLTILFNMWWDHKKQAIAEDWEFKRYQANLIHFSTAGLMEAFFSGKAELDYLTATLQLLLNGLDQLTATADAIVRQQGGPGLTVAELERRKAELLQPFQNYNQQQVQLRWNQYEQKVMNLDAKAEVHLTTLKPLVPADLYAELVRLYERLSAPFVWDLPHGREKLIEFQEALPQVIDIRENLMWQLEIKLGRNAVL